MAETARGKVEVDQNECKGCGLCIESCLAQALELGAELNHYGVRPARPKADDICSGCGICYYVCPEPGAITVYRRGAQKIEVRDAATV